MADKKLSDGALSIFVFAAYHSLVGGKEVGSVILHDGDGHSADSEGVQELQLAGLITIEESKERAGFTKDGKERLAAILQAVRGQSA